VEMIESRGGSNKAMLMTFDPLPEFGTVLHDPFVRFLEGSA